MLGRNGHWDSVEDLGSGRLLPNGTRWVGCGSETCVPSNAAYRTDLGPGSAVLQLRLLFFWKALLREAWQERSL